MAAWSSALDCGVHAVIGHYRERTVGVRVKVTFFIVRVRVELSMADIEVGLGSES